MKNRGIDRVIQAFLQGKSAKDGNVSTDGEAFRSYAMVIATRKDGRVEMVDYAECPSVTTKKHYSSLKRAI